MDALQVFLDELKRHGLDRGHTQGLLHVLIGRRLLRADGTVVSRGLTWRQVASLLRKIRWNKDAVRDWGLDPKALPPRDRQQYWYAAIGLARIDSPEGRVAGDALAALLAPLGYRVQ